MRSSEQFLEITGATNSKKVLINKRAIIFVTVCGDEEKSLIHLIDGDRVTRIPTKESYKDVSEELLWFGSKEIE